MKDSHWFEWNPGLKKPVAVNRKGKAALAAPLVCFIVFVISIPLARNVFPGKDWIMDVCFAFFALSFAVKALALFTKTRGFGPKKN